MQADRERFGRSAATEGATRDCGPVRSPTVGGSPQRSPGYLHEGAKGGTIIALKERQTSHAFLPNHPEFRESGPAACRTTGAYWK